jgi:hypothetical protein
MKKYICAAVAVMIVFSLASCSKENNEIGFTVTNGSLVKGKLGYVLTSKRADYTAAIKKIDQPYTNHVTVKFKMKTLPGRNSRNGFLAFGNSNEKMGLTFAGVRAGVKKLVIFSGVKNAETPNQKIQAGRIMNVTVKINLAEKSIVMNVDKFDPVKTTFSNKIKAVSYIGYMVNNASTEFSELEVVEGK